jgi:hypothetical protein
VFAVVARALAWMLACQQWAPVLGTPEHHSSPWVELALPEVSWDTAFLQEASAKGTEPHDSGSGRAEILT